MYVLSAWGWAMTPSGVRLPMQWNIRGEVNWRAPRAVALLFSPSLAVLTVGLTAWLATSEPGQMAWLSGAIATVFLLTHGVYLYFAIQDVKRNRA